VPLFRLILVVAVVIVAALLYFKLRGSSRRTIYVGGPVLTMNAASDVVEALGVDGKRIAAVGSEEELRRWAGNGARVVDLRGRALLPGFVDAHSHFPGVGIFAVHTDLNSPPIGTVQSIEDIVGRLTTKAAATSAGKWIGGLGYDDTLLAEKRHPTRFDLDRASTEHPIGIMHISGHLAVVNTRGLQELGFATRGDDPEGGRIRRDPSSGEPDGVLEETAAEPVTRQLIDLSFLDSLRVVRRASDIYVRAGVTTAQNGFAPKAQIKPLTWLSRLGIVPLRLILWPEPAVADRLLAGEFTFNSYDENWVRLGAVKLIADGSIQGYTGYLSQPYHIPPGDDPGYRGYPRIGREELVASVARYHGAGMQVAVHGNGDGTIDDILEAVENAQRLHPRSDARHVIVHAQMARDDQLDRMQRLGVIPSFFSLHTYYWGDRHRDIFMGPERAARMSPAQSALQRGIRFTIHTDAPVVPMEPLRLLWAAVNRLSSSGARIGEAERITVMQALRAMTIEAAHQPFEEEFKGSLEMGKLADLVILSRNPLDDPEHIDTIEVVETIVGGRTVYGGTDG
jgi:predicted amidohydrolase YtcJ